MGLTYKFVPPGTQLQVPGDLPSGIVFQSSWPNQTGTSDAAIRQTDRTTPWTEQYNNWIIQASTGGAPFANMATSRGRVPLGAFDNLNIENGWATPAVGESVAVRMYRRFSTSIASWDPETHGEYNIASLGDGWPNDTIGLYDVHAPSAPGEMATPLAVWSDAGDDFFYWWTAGGGSNAYSRNILLGSWYRYEYLYTRTGTNTFTMKYRVYDLAGTEIINETQMDRSFFDPQVPDPSTPLLSEYTFTRAGGGASRMRGLRLGINGLESQAPNNTTIKDIGAVLVRLGTGLSFPTGPYTSDEDTWTT